MVASNTEQTYKKRWRGKWGLGSLILLIFGLFLAFGCVQNPEEIPSGAEEATQIDGEDRETGNNGGDLQSTPPDTVSVTATGSHGVDVLFSQPMDKASAETKGNYVINGLSVLQASLDGDNPRLVHLDTSVQQEVTYTLLMVDLANTEGTSVPGGGIYRQFQGSKLIEAQLSWKDPENTSQDTSPPVNNPAYNSQEVFVEVSGSNIVSYKYALDGGTQSSEKDISEPIHLTGLLDGNHTLQVWGQRANGDWQEESYPTEHSWAQDTVAPTVLFVGSTLPEDPTDSQSVNISVTGSNVAKYYYKFSFESDWSGPFNKNQQIQNGVPLPEGPVTLSIRGMDQSGNAQPEQSATTNTWVINASAPFAKLDGDSLPPALSNKTSATISVTSTNDVTHYKGKIFEGSDCNQFISDLSADFNDSNYPEKSISEDMTAAGMNGPGSGRQYIVCVIGKDSLGKWQTLSSGTVTKATWIVDTDGLPASINWLSPYTNPGTTNGTDFSFEISGNGVSNYGFGLVPDDGADCSSIAQDVYTGSEKSVEEQLHLTGLSGNPPTNYTLCVKGKDGIGNWQDTASSVSWTVDQEPPSSNPAITTGGSFSNLAVTFEWDNSNSDWAGYKIQVSTTSDPNHFADPDKLVAEANVAKESGTSSSYTYNVNPENGATYYARVKAKDAQGNWRSTWGEESSEHYVVGHIRGQVYEQENNSTKSPLNGVTVEVLDEDGDLLSQYPAVISANDSDSGADGIFEINNLRIGRNAYQLRFSKTDYYTTVKRNVTVKAGTTLSAGQNIVVSSVDHTTPQSISGKIVDGNDGWMLGYAKVQLLGSDGAIDQETDSEYGDCDSPAASGSPPTNIPKDEFDASSSTCGDFSFSNVEPGVYTIRVKSDSSWAAGNQKYFNLVQDNVAVTDEAVNVGRMAIIEELQEPTIKIVLTWGSHDPRDLDFHVTGTADPNLGGTHNDWNGDTCTFPNSWGHDPGFDRSNLFHVWAGRPNVGMDWQQQFSAKDSTYIEPDTTAYDGDNYFPLSPSATTALVQDANTGYGPETINFLSGYKNGTYWFTVFNWSYWFFDTYNSIYGDIQDNERRFQGWDYADNLSVRVYSSKGLELEIPFPVDQTQYYVNESGDSDLAGDGLTVDGGAAPSQKEFWRPFKMVVTGPGSGGRQIQVTPADSAFQNLQDQTAGVDENRCEQIW